MATSVTCLCGDIASPVQLDTSTDHSELQLCHCNNCRSVTGLLCTSYYLMQHGPTSLEGLQEYRECATLSRFFCKSCGAHIFARAADRFLVASGVVRAEDVPAVRSIQHWKVDDTRDGGLSAYIPGPSIDVNCRLKSIARQTHCAISESPSKCIRHDRKELHARCHCGGIEFHLTRPDASSFQAVSPWPDLLVPYHSGSGENPGHVKWWLQANNTKYLAGTCACPSCRLGSGFPIQVWAFVPKSNIFHQDGSQLRFNFGTMQQYTSSPGVYREFCKQCGATAFWHNDERATLIDVSVGLFREDGARAESWLGWASERVSFSELAIQRDLVSKLEEGITQNAHHS